MRHGDNMLDGGSCQLLEPHSKHNVHGLTEQVKGGTLLTHRHLPLRGYTGISKS